MERGVYFDAWYPRQHCYHPSLPPRRLRMVEDLQEYHATVLVWSALGGGSLSLPYLESEAFGEVPPRFRFYGFLNDSEFIRECQKHGIKVFGIVFEVQGWEFPVELNEAEDCVLSLNELKGAGKQSWIGLREFSKNRYPKLWPPIEKYFPDGLMNSDGERVTDLIEECCSRDIYGNPCHARWVECPDREHQCIMMDRNNPVWREYLKAVIRLQVEAGVDGIQLDEAELPITSFQYGGCFCKDCMKGFRLYLQNMPVEQLPAELAGVDLEHFHYGDWLLKRGYDFKENREDTPLFWDYLRYQQESITRYFAELADYARQYAESKGRRLQVSGNFFNLFDQYYPLEPNVDLIITEMRNTRYCQPAWYRYVAGFAADKPVIVVENPYGGVVPELVENLKVGRGYDLFRMSIFEAAALGANMSIPYGSWMGSVIQESFYAPHELCVEVQTFLAEHEQLYSTKTFSEIAVVYSIESNFQMVARRDQFADNRANVSGSEVIPFWEVCEKLSHAIQPYDVIFFPDGKLRPDSLAHVDFHQYRTIILPDCRYLTSHQANLLNSFINGGGNLVVLGGLGVNLPSALQETILDHPKVTQLTSIEALAMKKLKDGAQITIHTTANMAVHLQNTGDSVALHLIRYDYDPIQDRVPILPELDLDLRLPGSFQNLTAFAPGQAPKAAIEVSGSLHHIELQNVPLYCILLLSPAI